MQQNISRPPLKRNEKYTSTDQLVLHQGIWHEQGHAYRGLIPTSDTLGKNNKELTAKMLYLSTLKRHGVFSKTNRLVMKWDRKAYRAAQSMIESVKVPNYNHGFCGTRPFSGLTTQCNMPTKPHKDTGDDGIIPSVCVRYGSKLNVQDQFILTDYNISFSYQPGDVIVGFLKDLTHEVKLSTEECQRYTLVHYLKKDIAVELGKSK